MKENLLLRYTKRKRTQCTIRSKREPTSHNFLVFFTHVRDKTTYVVREQLTIK